MALIYNILYFHRLDFSFIFAQVKPHPRTQKVAIPMHDRGCVPLSAGGFTPVRVVFGAYLLFFSKQKYNHSAYALLTNSRQCECLGGGSLW